MQNQTQSTFTMRIASSSGTASCTASTQDSATQSDSYRIDSASTASPVIDLMAAYRNSRMAAHSSLASMRSSSRPGSGYFRRAA